MEPKERACHKAHACQISILQEISARLKFLVTEGQKDGFLYSPLSRKARDQ